MNSTTGETSVSPLVYVVLVNWNGKDDTLACLRSLRGVDYPRFRMVVVDNASSDGSVEAIAAQFPDINLVCNQKNELFSGANNQGIDIALSEGADFVLLLNNDTEVDSNFLTHMIETALSAPKIGMVGPKIYFFDQPDVLWYAGGVVNLRRGLVAHRGIRNRDCGQFDATGDTGYITACSILVSRECIEKVGVLDAEYYMYGEDMDWCYRARQAGFRLVYEPRARVWHKVSSSSGGKHIPGGLTPFKIQHKIRSTLKFFWRYAKWHHWLTIPFFAIGYFFKAAWFMARSGNWAGIGAMVSAAVRKKS
jgi:GT2 family glycosyltransferase